MSRPSAPSLKEYERLSRFVFVAMKLIADSGEFPTLGPFPTEEEWALRMADVRFSNKLSGMRERGAPTYTET